VNRNKDPRITTEQFEQVVGQAWESSTDTGVKSVPVAVGLLQRDPSVSRLVQFNRQQAQEIAALRAELAAMKLEITKERDSMKGLRRLTNEELQLGVRLQRCLRQRSQSVRSLAL